MLKIGTAEYFESLERFRKRLPSGKDAELLILKGHLLVETLLEKYLRQNLPHPDALADARLSFAQKLAFVASLRSDPDEGWLWDSIRLLNRLRNELAHHIDSQRYDLILHQFIDAVEASPELPVLEPPSGIHERLHRALFSVHEAMSHRVDL